MYETYFGLNKRPFRALAEGTDVFVGPQAAGTMAAMKKALVGSDTVIAVSGPVGVGKTTIVRRALAGFAENLRIISIGRIQLGHDEVLEMLLEEMGVPVPTGTVQRFAALRRHLKEFEDRGNNVVVVVEDAARVGADALAELEALTAADAGVSEGARVVVMGDESMNDVMQMRHLARLKQRLRLRQLIVPLSSNELTGYLKHCFRLAGKEFDAVFEQGSAQILHTLSEGIPRMANGIVESCLATAAENKQATVSVKLLKQVAETEYGLDVDLEDAASACETAATPDTPSATEPVTEAQPVSAQAALAVPEPAASIATPVAEEPIAQETIPELIQDTLPDLAILSPGLAQFAVTEAVPVAPEKPVKPEGNTEIPTLPKEDAIPDWERDPTLAQLRPDLDALEHAMAVAQGLEADDEEMAEPPAEEDIPELVPEITLDREIQAKIEEAAELLKQAELKENTDDAEDAAKAAPVADKQTTTVNASAAPKPEPEAKPEIKPEAKPAPAVTAPIAEKPIPEEPVLEAPVPEQPAIAKPKIEKPGVELADIPAATGTEEITPDSDNKTDAELERIAVNLARAKTIDDCDDKMAETLFGEEFSIMAAQVAANAPAVLSANDGMELEIQQSAAFSVADFEGSAALSVELESDSGASLTKLDASASQRLATVRALNATQSGPSPEVEAVAMSHYEAPPPRPSGSEKPDSIEDQINTSITQTLKALKVSPPQSFNDDEDGEPKGGFFSRFRRS